MLGGPVAYMSFEPVPGKDFGALLHESVPGDFGHDGGGADGGLLLVAPGYTLRGRSYIGQKIGVTVYVYRPLPMLGRQL
jgi:hypothetical protein